MPWFLKLFKVNSPVKNVDFLCEHPVDRRLLYSTVAALLTVILSDLAYVYRLM